MIGTIIPQAQAAVVSVSIIKNILAGFAPSIAGIDALTAKAKDIGGFRFDYIGEERLEAGNEVTDHYAEDNTFMQSHRAVKPTLVTARGFAAETTFDKSHIIGNILSIQSALAVVRPYAGTYAPGATAKMAKLAGQANQVANQVSQAMALGDSVLRLVGVPRGVAVFPDGTTLKITTAAQQAYYKLEGLRQQGNTMAVVTPYRTFPNMLIENLVLVSPEETRGLTDIIVRLKEIRFAPSLSIGKQDNARGSQVPTQNGTQSAVASGARVA